MEDTEEDDLDKSVWVPVLDLTREEDSSKVIETDVCKLTEKEIFVRKAQFVSFMLFTRHQDGF